MKISLTALSIFLSATSFAQSLTSARISSGLDIGAGAKSQRISPSIVYYQLLNLGDKKLLSFGWSLKFSSFYGQNMDYLTAPARLTRGKEGFSALGAPLVPTNIDTVTFANVSMTNLNLGLRAQVQLGPVQLGVSADIFGVGFGRKRTGLYQSSTGTYTVTSSTNTDSTVVFKGDNANQAAHPSNLNVRLLGDNNIGTLSSEVYARFPVSQRLSIKVGYQWLTTEMTVSNRDTKANNNRFRNRSDFPYIAVTLPLY